MNRRLAGIRRNKHLPIARATRPSDRRATARSAHYLAGGWTGTGWRHTSGAYCACGLTYDGFEAHRQAADLIDAHAASTRRPNHLARAVDITAIWPPLPEGAGRDSYRRAAVAGARGRSAEPMSMDRRLRAYFRQRELTTGTPRLTRRQTRRIIRLQFRAGLAAA